MLPPTHCSREKATYNFTPVPNFTQRNPSQRSCHGYLFLLFITLEATVFLYGLKVLIIVKKGYVIFYSD
jgi:hypothetical protein